METLITPNTRTQRNELVSLATQIDEKLKVKINKPGKDPLS